MVKLRKNDNFKKLTLRGGISLITLVITIVVIIILATAVILSLNNNNLIGNANKATVKNDISEVQSSYSIYIGDLIIEELDNVQGNGTIGITTSDFTTTTGAGVKEKRNITLKDIGVDSNNIEEISIAGNTVVGIKWKNKYYDVNGNVVTDENYRFLLGKDNYKGVTITADTKGVTYTDKDGNEKALTETVEDGDAVVYGDYEYRYNMVFVPNSGWDNIENVYFEMDVDAGWGVRVIDDTKNKYGEICGTILGKDVTNMYSTFENCTSLIESPKIPNTVTCMIGTFSECISLVEAPDIPYGVKDMLATFYGCTLLTKASEIPSSVTNLGDTFNACTSLVNAPRILTESKSQNDSNKPLTRGAIPNYGLLMYRTFYGCTSLVNVTEIPDTVSCMIATFLECTSLTGNIVIKANPKSYHGCFEDTTLPIKLIKSGNATDETISGLAATANNGNVTY